MKLGIVDEVLKEPSGGNNWAPLQAGDTLKNALEKHLSELLALSPDELRNNRYSKFRKWENIWNLSLSKVKFQFKVLVFAFNFLVNSINYGRF